MNKTITIMLAFLLVASFVSAINIKSISKDPGQIAPGESSDIRVLVENDGNADIKDVSVSVSLIDSSSPLTFDSSSQKTIDEINEDEDESASFKISALDNAKSGVYKIQITASYVELVNLTPSVKTTSSVTSIIVNSVPELDVNKEEGLLLIGQENTVTFKIVNKGLSDVQFLEIQLADSGYTLLSPSKVYIGTLASDDTDTAAFKMILKNSGTISFPITLTYKDIENKLYTQQFSVDARVYSNEEAIQLGLVKKSNTGMIVTVIIILIIVYIIYRQVRKFLKNRKKAREAAGK